MPGEVGLPVVRHVVVLWLHERETVITLRLIMAANRVNPKMLKKLRVTVINLVRVSNHLEVKQYLVTSSFCCKLVLAVVVVVVLLLKVALCRFYCY